MTTGGHKKSLNTRDLAKKKTQSNVHNKLHFYILSVSPAPLLIIMHTVYNQINKK